MNIENELWRWAEKTSEKYMETGQSFYTQSNLRKIKEDRIELLILGINPGSESVSFDKWRKQECWKSILPDLNDKASKDKMPEILLKGNPCYEERAKWLHWRKLCRIFSNGGIEHLLHNESSFVETNLILSSTKVEKELSQKLWTVFPEYAFELIDILKPKNIVCLGNVVRNKVFQKKFKQLSDNDRIDYTPVYYKENDGTKFFSIHHPSFRYSKEEIELTGKCLGTYITKDIKVANPSPKELNPYIEAYCQHFKIHRNNQ